MRKFHVIGLTLVAVFAFCALTASAAFAESEWLVEGAKVEAALEAETEGDITLIKFKAAKSSVVLTEILCSGFFVGTLGPGKEDRVTAILNLKFEAAGELEMTGEEQSIDCEVTFDEGSFEDCRVGTIALVWVDHLNAMLGDWWDTEIILDPNGEFLDHFTSNLAGFFPGYEVECESLIGIRGIELCEGLVTADLTNEVGTVPAAVLGEFLETPVAERGTCTRTGAESADVRGDGNTWAVQAGVRLATSVS
jgi:hypothetical protein